MDLSTIALAWEAVKGTIGLVILGSALYYLPDWGFVTQQITAYPALCRNKVVDNRCSAPIGPLTPTTYRVTVGSQTVVYWKDDVAPGRYSDCAVRDRSNWACMNDDRSLEVGFVGGEYFIRNSARAAAKNTLAESTYYTSRWQYLKFKAGLRK